MRVKRFEANSVSEALDLIRAELGESAVILETRRLRGGLLGFGSRPRVEVLAGIEEKPASVEKQAKNSSSKKDSTAKSLNSTRLELLVDRFMTSGVSDSLTRTILEAASPRQTDAELIHLITSRLRVAPFLPTGNCARVALVGPTGVGKTTTVAKLAARYALNEKKRVALITMDTYRVAAVEQLKTYARVMGLPVEVAQTPEEMRLAVDRHSDKDLILIDTIGRSPQKALHLAEIKAFLNAAEPTETHLVVSAPFGMGYLTKTAQHFSSMDTNRLIVTKLDEIPRWGVILSLVHQTGLPISFVTDGQEVPRNLRPANAEEIALQILGGIE